MRSRPLKLLSAAFLLAFSLRAQPPAYDYTKLTVQQQKDIREKQVELAKIEDLQRSLSDRQKNLQAQLKQLIESTEKSYGCEKCLIDNDGITASYPGAPEGLSIQKKAIPSTKQPPKR